VRADARVADVRRARVVVDALRVRGAGKAARDGGVDAGAHRVARIGGARVSVVAVEGWPHGADARQARLGTVAHVAIAARGTVRQRRVLAAGQRITGVRGTRVVVVAVEGRAGRANAELAGLRAVAGVAVAARGAVRQRRVLTPAQHVAGVRGAGTVVVAVERRPGATGARLAGLGPVAHVPVAARRAVHDRDVPAAGGGIAAVGGAGVVVVAAEGRAARAHAGLAGLHAVADVAVPARGPVRQRGALTGGAG